MTRRDPRATAAGVLLIAATAASLAATACYGSSLKGSGFVTAIAAHQGRMLAGALFALIAAFASAAIAVSLYPVLRRHAPAMTLGSVGFRLIEGMFYALSAVSVLVLVTLVGSDATEAGIHVPADLVRALHDSASLAAILAFYIGGTLYYLVFYRSRLIPRWLSAWGLVGTTLGAAAALLVLFQTLDLLSGVHTLLNVPIGLQEMVLAFWLLRRGFSDGPQPARALPRRGRLDAGSPAAPPLSVMT
jgi:hypothetical protein